MKDLIIRKLEEMIKTAMNKKADTFIFNRLGDSPTLKQIDNLLTKVKEDADQSDQT